jgi:hypothetical protein
MIPQLDSLQRYSHVPVPSTSSHPSRPARLRSSVRKEFEVQADGGGLGSIDDLEAVPPQDAGSLRRCLVCLQIGAVLPRLQRILISKGPMSRAGP